MYLGNQPPGRLLEIGCGSGERLAHFAAKGWNVQGQDVDAKAVAHARESTALPVHLGPIESLPESAGPFDAVVMNHVIEHVHDPVALLRRAAALLAPGGVLVAVTPNISSINHRRFRESWRGLEPPRHLHLFSPPTLRIVAQTAGFHQVRVRTSAVHAAVLIRASLEIESAGRFRTKNPGAPSLRVGIQIILLQLEAMIRHKLDPISGEECILIADADVEPHPFVDPLDRYGAGE
jgi:SAM-dependent methyltransferase